MSEQPEPNEEPNSTQSLYDHFNYMANLSLASIAGLIALLQAAPAVQNRNTAITAIALIGGAMCISMFFSSEIIAYRITKKKRHDQRKYFELGLYGAHAFFFFGISVFIFTVDVLRVK